jgi:protein involved in temperature-dependent protein secretion
MSDRLMTEKRKAMKSEITTKISTNHQLYSPVLRAFAMRNWVFHGKQIISLI